MGELFPLVSCPRGDDGKRISMHEIVCSRCKAADTLVANRSRYPEEHVRGTFQQRGWRISNSGAHVCPACVRAEGRANAAARAKHQQEKDMAKAVNVNIASADDDKALAEAVDAAFAKPAVPSPDASKLITAIYVVLEDVYLPARRAYKAGWDDARVAKEVGVSPVLVAERRERDFGPLVRDTTLEDLRAEVQRLLALHNSAHRHLADAQKCLAEAAKERDEAGKLAMRLHGLVDRIVGVETRQDGAGAP